MSRVIIKYRDMYAEYSTVMDAPVTFGMTLEQLRQRVESAYGREGLRELPRRLKRVEQYGTSSMMDRSLEETVECNRAGYKERRLPWERMLQIYMIECRQPTKEDGGDVFDPASPLASPDTGYRPGTPEDD